MQPHRLDRGWQLCMLPVDAAWPGDGGIDWLDIDEPLTAAASLRRLGRWSINDTTPRFDAQDWCWRLRFDAPPADGAWQLRFDGLATLAEVRLNGHPVLASDDMFVAHTVDASPHLVPGINELLIRCRSVDAALAARRPRPRWRAPMVEHQQLRGIRTTLLGRTPGWSPAAAPVGPWRDVWLQPVPTVVLDERVVRVDHDGRIGRLSLQGRLQAPGACRVELVCMRDGITHRTEAAWQADGSLQAELSIDGAAPWWPHTHGEPVLYDAALTLTGDGGTHTLPLGRIGFRRVAIDQTDGGFRLMVNGEPVFCRGACWTPLDAVSLRASPTQLRTAVQQVRDAGMNMLRLAGTLVPEEDAFYDACDEAGVLVWQEFAFANMDYPADAAFTATVATEVTQHLQRWQHHACLAVLCGNSEQEQQAAMWGADRGLWQPALFHEHIAGWCRRWAPDTPYWPSSAHGGAFPFRPDSGTTSYYGVGAYLRPLDDARTSGLCFATECLAFANVPPASTLTRLPGGGPAGDAVRPHAPAWKAGVPRDLGAGWDFDDVRDHYLERFTGERPERLRAVDPARHLAIARWASGHAMAEAFAQWRAAGSACGGALVWFLRDLRPGAGWGLLDEQGVPKAAWHLLRRMLRPVMMGFVDGGLNGFDLHLVNEQAHEVDAVLQVHAWRAGQVRVAEVHRPVQLAPRSVQRLSLVGELDGFADLGHAYRFGPPACELLLARLHAPDGTLLAEGSALPQGLPMARLPQIGLQASLTREADGLWLDVSAQACAIGLHIDAPGHAPRDDYLLLAPGEQRRIALDPLPSATPPRAVRVTVAALNTEQTVTVVA